MEKRPKFQKFQIVFPAKKDLEKEEKVNLYIDGKFAGEIGSRESLRCLVSSGMHKIHLTAPFCTKSNEIEIEMLNKNLYYDWGMEWREGEKKLWTKPVLMPTNAQPFYPN